MALVIGNGAYLNATRLANPTNDAADVARALRAMGFEIIEGADLDKRGMEARIVEFGEKLDRADMALFFYAGHGMQVGGKNYLIPIDAKLERAGNLNFEALDVTLVLNQMEAGKRTNLVFLDACRDNPLARSFARSLGASRSASVGHGLARVDSGVGTLIAYATQPDNVALDGYGQRNSPFTTALLNHIATPGLEIRGLMTRVRADVLAATRDQQLPWDHSSLVGDVYLVPGAPAPQAVTGGVQPNSGPSLRADEFAWSFVRDSRNPEVLRRFIAQFPESANIGEATARLKELEQPALAALPPTASPAPSSQAAAAPDRRRLVIVKRSLDQIKKSGQTGEIGAFSFSADSRRVAAASREGRLLVLETATGKLLHDLPAGFATGSVAFAPRGDRLVSADHYGNISVWDSRTGALSWKVDTKDMVNSLAFSPDGREFASGHASGRINIWEASASRKLRQLAGEGDGWVTGLAYSPDGKRIASGGHSKTLRLWDAGSGAALQAIGLDNMIIRVLFSPDGRRIVADAIPTVVIDAATIQPVHRFKSSDTTAGYLADGRHLLRKSGSNIGIWDAASWTEARKTDVAWLSRELDVGYLQLATVSPDGRWVATAFAPNSGRFLKANLVVMGSDGYARIPPSTDLDQVIVIWPIGEMGGSPVAAQ